MRMKTAAMAGLVAGVLGMAAAGGTWAGEEVRIGDDGSVTVNGLSTVGPYPVSKTTHERLDFSPTGHIDVRDIGSSVEVSAGDGKTVEFDYERKARTQQDFDCETLRYEPSKDRLKIWVQRKHDRACRTIYASDKLTLKIPRGASITLGDIGDSVTVSGIDGLVRLDSIGDRATLTGVSQLRADSIGDSLRLEVDKVGKEGIDIDSVGDSVELTLPDKLDAKLQIGSVGDEIRGPGLRIESPGNFETVLGEGGPRIRIGSVGDSVVIHGGPGFKKGERKGEKL
jgi:hypothetical protein